jgi:hypothetical protein
MRITDGQNLLIGTTTEYGVAAGKLQVLPANETPVFQSAFNGVAYSVLDFDVNRSGSTETIVSCRARWNAGLVAEYRMVTGDDTTNKDEGRHFWYTRDGVNDAGANQRRMYLDRDGTLVIDSTYGSGIKLDNLASSDANTLDDYEEGTFTPTINGSTLAGAGTYADQHGTYVKVGEVCHFQIYLAWTAHTGTGNMNVTGLPFTVESGADGYSAASIWSTSLLWTATAGEVPQAYTNQGTVQIVLKVMKPATGGAQADVPIDTAGSLILSGTYRVN